MREKTGLEAKRKIEEAHGLQDGELKAVVITTRDAITIYGVSSIIEYMNTHHARRDESARNAQIVSHPLSELPSNHFNGEVREASLLGLKGHGGGKVVFIRNSRESV